MPKPGQGERGWGSDQLRTLCVSPGGGQKNCVAAELGCGQIASGGHWVSLLGGLRLCAGINLQIFFFSFFLEPRLQHTEVPRLWVEWELQLPAYATAIAMPDPSCV